MIDGVNNKDACVFFWFIFNSPQDDPFSGINILIPTLQHKNMLHLKVRQIWLYIKALQNIAYPKISLIFQV